MHIFAEHDLLDTDSSDALATNTHNFKETSLPNAAEKFHRGDAKFPCSLNAIPNTTLLLCMYQQCYWH